MRKYVQALFALMALVSLAAGPVVMLLIIALAPVGAMAGGLTMYEIGTSDTGYASAGYAARASDPGTILTNPAGMTRLKESQLLIGGQALYGHANLSTDIMNTNVTGSDGGNAIGLLPGLSAFGTYKYNDDIALGFGMCSNFGLGLWYDPNWAGRYYVKNAVLMGMSFMPAFAYKITDQFSVGVALNIMAGYFSDKVAINNADPRWPDGELSIKNTTLGIGGNVGLLYEPTKRTRFGVTYNSPVDLNFSATPKFTTTGPILTDLIVKNGLNSKELNLGMTVPQGVMVSFYQDLTDQWALLGNFGWQNWHQFGKVDISLSNSRNPEGITTNINYNDTWHGALGAQYQLSEPWLLTGGVAYDSGMLDSAQRSPSLPLSWAWRFALGSQYALSKTTQLGFAYEYLYSGNPDISKSGQLPLVLGGRGDLAGSYPNSSIQYFSANVTWKF
jgi:long-chain fatty acid transport protein